MLADGIVVGRIMKVTAALVGQPGFQHEDRTPTHGYEPPREGAMAAFARS